MFGAISSTDGAVSLTVCTFFGDAIVVITLFFRVDVAVAAESSDARLFCAIGRADRTVYLIVFTLFGDGITIIARFCVLDDAVATHRGGQTRELALSGVTALMVTSITFTIVWAIALVSNTAGVALTTAVYIGLRAILDGIVASRHWNEFAAIIAQLIASVALLAMLCSRARAIDALACDPICTHTLLCHAVIAIEDKAWVAIDAHGFPFDEAEFADRRFAVDTLAGVGLTLTVH